MHKLARTTLLSIGLLGGAAATARAELAYHETLVHDTTTAVEITLDESTVLCSSADYGALFLKVGMPELAAVTLLDHQNIGAGAPCVAAGLCVPGNMPSDIIDAADPTETVDINVKALRGDSTDSTAQTCETYLIERVRVVIRGVEFTHERTAPLGSRPFADCVSSSVADPGSQSATEPEPTTEDGKADAHDTVEPTPGAGCSATAGGSSSALAALMLGAVAVLRRRTRSVRR